MFGRWLPSRKATGKTSDDKKGEDTKSDKKTEAAAEQGQSNVERGVPTVEHVEPIAEHVKPAPADPAPVVESKPEVTE